MEWRKVKGFVDFSLILFKSLCLEDAAVPGVSPSSASAEAVKGLHPPVTISTDVTHA